MRRGKQAGESERSWRHLSDGTPCPTAGLTEFAATVGCFSSSERTFLSPSTYRGGTLWVLLRFSNRCLSCSDQTRSTTWLHPRTGEPVNSGHMIRSGTPQTSPDLRSTPGLVPRCGCFRRFNAVSACFTDLPRGWEEGFTDEGASYFIKSVASQHCLTALACCFSLVHHR